MLTGVETAGLVLATLPILIEVAKSYKSGIDTAKDIVVQSRQDENLSDFYTRFLFEVTILNSEIGILIDGLPGLSNARRETLLQNIRLEDWQPDADVSLSLQKCFGRRHYSFCVTINKIMQP